MTVEPKIALRLQFLARVVRKECKHLTTTDQRLFGGLFSLEQIGLLEEDPDLAERLGLLKSADEWMTMCNLRNQMIHEYVEDPVVLVSTLQTGHAFVPDLVTTANKMISEIERRGWV